MCTRRPCWPTPLEAQAIIDAGKGDRLMLDYWVGSITDCDDDQCWHADVSEVLILGPAIVGHESGHAPSFPVGRCAFLSPDGKCELYDGLQPLEGRLADCQNDLTINIHEAVARTWANPTAQEVALAFARANGLREDES